MLLTKFVSFVYCCEEIGLHIKLIEWHLNLYLTFNEMWIGRIMIDVMFSIQQDVVMSDTDAQYVSKCRALKFCCF